MQSNLTISLVLAIGVAGYTYARLMRSTGGNRANAVKGAIGFGLLAGLAMMVLLSLLFKN